MRDGYLETSESQGPVWTWVHSRPSGARTISGLRPASLPVGRGRAQRIRGG
jgi:hypothetical protein